MKLGRTKYDYGVYRYRLVAKAGIWTRNIKKETFVFNNCRMEFISKTVALSFKKRIYRETGIETELVNVNLGNLPRRT